MATFVIVHGAFGGGWEWSAVARTLRRLGHEVFTPTLTGFGERHHLGPAVGLSTNVQDVVSLLEFEDLANVVLCGASYGGMAVTGAAAHSSNRVALLTYIDAVVPLMVNLGWTFYRDCLLDVLAGSDSSGHGWVSVPSAVLPPTHGITPETRKLYVSRLRPQPVATFTVCIRLSSASEDLSRAYIRCTDNSLDVEGDPIEPHAARARVEGWHYRELAAPHDPQLFYPERTAAVLDELTSAVLGRSI